MSKTTKKKHPWRPCPLGEHWVKEHPRTVPVSEKNPSRHEIFVADEIYEISSQHFKELKNKPKADAMRFPHGNDFDDLIAGWTQFWNEIFEPTEPLDPNLIKALIASESGFEVQASADSKIGVAKGLIQITEQTRKILTDQKGELKDFLITLSKKEVTDPNLNLFAGIRWLFHKKYLAGHRLKREASWIEAIAEYKGILNQLGRVKEADDIMEKLKKYHERLSKK
ncbi:MAG: transglycosylase SLT domain-containing protein [Bdellovibrionales bacterium]|nr:transglycosylase SLT domain-containing protein [Bdellovibrionales bacterium]